MTPGQPILSFKKDELTSNRTDKDYRKNLQNEGEIIDKYKKRYGDRWESELEKAVTNE